MHLEGYTIVRLLGLAIEQNRPTINQNRPTIKNKT
jgi:hypothetical protein